jgi:tripartite-type tricarboxylate transporter receptor subunit TctC
MTPTDRTRRRALHALAALPLAATTLAPRTAAAQERVVKFLLPNATGSGVDAITRAMQPAFAKLVGANVIVENQPGAGGIVGLQALARAQPDGTTLSVVSNNVVIFPNLHKSLPFAMPDDFSIVTVCGYTPLVLVANPKVPAKDSRELVALMKAKPDGLTYGSSGAGTILHLAAAMYLDETGTQARHVPYKGVGPMVTDLLGGHVDFVAAALPSVQQHLKSGALRAIGVGTDRRIAAAPEIPTFVEQGVPKYVVEAWFAVLGPKGMPAAEVQKVRDAVAAALAAPEVKETMDRQGNVINVLSVEAAQRFVRAEQVKYAALSRKIGLEAQ